MLQLWRAVGYGYILLIIWLSLRPDPIEIGVRHGDTLEHFSAYALLMYWFCQIHVDTTARIRCAVAFAALGVALEILQHLSGYRTGDVWDAAANVTGIAMGWAAAPPRLPNLRRLAESLVAFARGHGM